MFWLVLKFVVVVLGYVAAVYGEWSAKQRFTTFLTAVYAVAAATSVAVLVYDHMEQDKRTSEARNQAEAEQHGREQAEAERQAILASTQHIAAVMQELDPTLTAKEALDLVAPEIRDLRTLTTELEEQLEGLRRYGDVAQLGVMGESQLTEGPNGLGSNTPLVQTLRGTWMARDGRWSPRCDQEAVQKYNAAIDLKPTFPFTYFALFECAFAAGDDAWRKHADTATEIFRHTTQIAGHHPTHSEAYGILQDRLSQERG